MICLLSVSNADKTQELKEFLLREGLADEDICSSKLGLFLDILPEEGEFDILNEMVERFFKDCKGEYALIPDAPTHCLGRFSKTTARWLKKHDIQPQAGEGDAYTLLNFEDLLDLEPQKEQFLRIVETEILKKNFEKQGRDLTFVPSNLILTGPAGAGKKSFSLSAAHLLGAQIGREVNYFDVASLRGLAFFEAHEIIENTIESSHDSVLVFKGLDVLQSDFSSDESGQMLDCFAAFLGRLSQSVNGAKVIATASGTMLEAFAKGNDLFKKAFPHVISFPPPSLTTLTDIFKQKARLNDLPIDKGVPGLVRSHLAVALKAKKTHFGYGHEVDELMAKCVNNMANRLARGGVNLHKVKIKQLRLMPEDVPSFTVSRRAFRPAPSKTDTNILYLCRHKPQK